MRAMSCRRVAFAGYAQHGSAMPEPLRQFESPFAAYRAGFVAAWTSVFAYVIFGTYVGIGALAYDFGFSLPWLALSTLLVWAGPAQVILVSALGGGAALIEVAIAVGLSGVRLLPMVVALLPVLRAPKTRARDLILPAHFTAVSMWVESMRLAPGLAPEWRVIFCNGLGTGLIVSASIAGVFGYYLAARLPVLMTAALLFLTPISFLISVARNSRDLADKLALALGLIIGPALAYSNVDLDILWAGVGGGTLAYFGHRLRESLR
jgi:predicted branched-subunit amino acid permease